MHSELKLYENHLQQTIRPWLPLLTLSQRVLSPEMTSLLSWSMPVPTAMPFQQSTAPGKLYRSLNDVDRVTWVVRCTRQKISPLQTPQEGRDQYEVAERTPTLSGAPLAVNNPSLSAEGRPSLRFVCDVGWVINSSTYLEIRMGVCSAKLFSFDLSKYHILHSVVELTYVPMSYIYLMLL
jgi:hypothetical protein